MTLRDSLACNHESDLKRYGNNFWASRFFISLIFHLMHLILRVFGARERPVKVEIKLFAFYIYNRRLEANICIKYLDPAGLSGHGLRFALVSISSCGITCEIHPSIDS
ncbi:uncharacterized protein LOC131053326 isoform X3 [Cryptomeria japonica]|uniref:uncharacterized protein LOC131053326 isoform X3 n=1 Tax=Cryptomeria japonica TaxID=3369 RepID=UPI0027DA1D16|nr:uncharacterized protein LOC131053326 isoform X3 [Cryptomeria japonica]